MCRMVHSLTCSGILPSQYAHFSQFVLISCIGRDVIYKCSAFGCSLLHALYQNFFTVYQKLGYIELVGKAAEDCMLAAIREVEATSDYSS